jgi:hypothetical protein
VILSNTILGRAYPEDMKYGQGAGNIGITCGCYARFMRQLAHLADRWTGNGREEQRDKYRFCKMCKRPLGEPHDYRCAWQSSGLVERDQTYVQLRRAS